VQWDGGALAAHALTHNPLHISHVLHAPLAHNPNTNAIIGIAYDAFDPDVICEEFHRIISVSGEANRDYNKVDKGPKEDPKTYPNALARGK
jgi:hypothetical protein